jgi:hypothetical protein
MCGDMNQVLSSTASNKSLKGKNTLGLCSWQDNSEQENMAMYLCMFLSIQLVHSEVLRLQSRETFFPQFYTNVL